MAAFLSFMMFILLMLSLILYQQHFIHRLSVSAQDLFRVKKESETLRHCGPYILARKNLILATRWLEKEFPENAENYHRSEKELLSRLDERFAQYDCFSPEISGFHFHIHKKSGYPRFWPVFHSWHGSPAGQ
ncbi:MAG: hypothetical protein H6618_10125 [Deltaproteobacteria bacterium]|nr:hypothetical protein [Deltaproteobacteria bacterium]